LEVQFEKVEVCDIFGSSLATVETFAYLYTEVHFSHIEVHILYTSSLLTTLRFVRKFRYRLEEVHIRLQGSSDTIEIHYIF
jgi:hypothetical protein